MSMRKGFVISALSLLTICFAITLYHCTFRVMIFERSMILCLVVYNFVLVERNLLLFVIPYIIIIYLSLIHICEPAQTSGEVLGKTPCIRLSTIAAAASEIWG